MGVASRRRGGCVTWRDATRCAGLALRGAAWRAALAWCALPRLRGCPAWRAAPAWRGCPAWRAAPAGVIAQRCTSARLAWWPSVARCPGWRDRPALHVGPAGMIGPALHVGPAGVTGPAPHVGPAGGRSRAGRRASRVYTQSRRDCYYCAPVAAEKNFFVPVGDKIGRKRPTFGTAAKTVL